MRLTLKKLQDLAWNRKCVERIGAVWSWCLKWTKKPKEGATGGPLGPGGLESASAQFFHEHEMIPW